MGPAVVYLRVSTDEQAASLEAQEHACREWAEREGREVAGAFRDDGVSGGAPLAKRPGLLDALAALTRGAVLVVAKRDRLGREPVVVAMVESAAGRKGCRVASAAGEGTADDDPSSLLMRRLVDAFAEYERLIIKARTRAALSAKRRRCERTGGLPYGWEVDPSSPPNKQGRPGGLVPNVAEQERLRLMRTLAGEGLSPRAIACRLNAQSVPTKTGKGPWTRQAVSKMLARKV